MLYILYFFFLFNPFCIFFVHKEKVLPFGQYFFFIYLAQVRGFEPPRPLQNPTSLANSPLQPLGYTYKYFIIIIQILFLVNTLSSTFTFFCNYVLFTALISVINLIYTIYIGGECGIRTHGRYQPTPVFETSTLNQLRQLSIS